MLNFLHTYILIWQLPVVLAIASLALFPIRTTYNRVRIGDMELMYKGAVEPAFWATLWIGIAAILYWIVIALVPIVWICLSRKRVMSARAWMASLLALILCSGWYYAIHYLFHL